MFLFFVDEYTTQNVIKGDLQGGHIVLIIFLVFLSFAVLLTIGIVIVIKYVRKIRHFGPRIQENVEFIPVDPLNPKY